jgi:DNA polymerase III subunit beta
VAADKQLGDTVLSTTQTSITFLQRDLHDALSRVRHAICKEETRYYLRGVYMHATTEGVHFVATDGHRLARVTAKADGDYSHLVPVILPTDFVNTAIKATSKRSQCYRSVTLQVAASKVVLSLSGVEALECTPVDGTFPDYARVVPTGDPPHGIVAIPREQFQQACAAVTAYREAVEDCAPAIKLMVGTDTLTVTGKPCNPPVRLGTSVEFAPAVATIKDVSVTGGKDGLPPDIGFNSRYLLDIAKATTQSPVLQFHYFDHGGPCLFRGAADGSAYFVLMPTRLNG